MKVTLGKDGIAINGKEEILLCASLFYFRIPPKDWEARAKLLAGLGYNCVDVYFPWNFHERQPGIMEFAGERDADRFLSICEENNLYVVARPGPYICSEWDGGGLPSWIICGQEIRQNDGDYLEEVKKWYSAILPIIRKHQIGMSEKGSVILVQLENELDFFDCDDVEGYMGSLRDMALEAGITVPLFACAGQGDIRRSGGLTEGIFPTYNFYPKPWEGTFDFNLAQYAKYLRERELPFLVTETDRKHSILKRELLSGAKLLGAYNQVGGSNFEYYQSVNNWGDPLSLICTLYDFDGMIDNLGHCTQEADEALLLSELIRAFGTALAAGNYREIQSVLTFREEGVEFTNAVSMAEGEGKLLCVRSVREETVISGGSWKGYEFELCLKPYEAVALPMDLQCNGFEILFSNNEIFSLEPLAFIKRSKPFLAVRKNGKELLITEAESCDTIKADFITREEAVARIKKQRGLDITYCREAASVSQKDCMAGEFHNRRPFIKTESSLFSDNGVWRGEVEYRIQSNGKRLFFKGAGDFLTVKNDDQVVYSGLRFCDDVITEGKGEVTATVEKWGHSNFDDARKKSLRIKAERGVEKIYQLISEEEIKGWRFTEIESFGDEVTVSKTNTDPYLSINSWNSTKEPLLAAYYCSISPEVRDGEELIMYLMEQESECKLFINGKFVFSFTQASPSINITKLVSTHGDTLVELCVRKQDWDRKAGKLMLGRVIPCELEMRQIVHQDVSETPLKPSDLPLPLLAGKMYAVRIKKSVKGNTYGYVGGQGFRATVMQDGKVIARVVAPSDQIVQAGCPDHTKFLIPQGKDDSLYFYMEAMANGSFSFAAGEDTDENSNDSYKRNTAEN